MSAPLRCRRTRKLRHRTFLDARIVLAGRVAKDTGECRAYRCPFCHGWHLTSQKPRTSALGAKVA